MQLVVSFFRLPNVQAKFSWGKKLRKFKLQKCSTGRHQIIVLIFIFNKWKWELLFFQSGENNCLFRLVQVHVHTVYTSTVYPCNSFPEVHVQARNRNQAKTGTNNPLIGQIWSSFLTFSCKSGGLYTLFISRWLTGHCQQVIIFGRKNMLWWQLPL